MATVATQRAAIAAALTAASVKNTSDPTLATGLERIVVIYSQGSDVLGGIGFKAWGFRLVCLVPLDAKSSAVALDTLRALVLTALQSLAGCELRNVGPDGIGTVEGGTRYLGCDINVQLVVTI